MRPILALILPNEETGGMHIVAASTKPQLLRLFKEEVLERSRAEVEKADDEIGSLVARAELDRLNKVFCILIPDGTGDGDGEEAPD